MSMEGKDTKSDASPRDSTVKKNTSQTELVDRPKNIPEAYLKRVSG